MAGTDFDSPPLPDERVKRSPLESAARQQREAQRGGAPWSAPGSGDGGTRQEEGLRRVPEAAERVGVLLAHPSDQGDDAVLLIDHLASAAAGQADGSPVLGRQLVVCLVLAALAELPEVLIVVRHLV